MDHEPTDISLVPRYRCNLCGFDFSPTELRDWNFCPKCGAPLKAGINPYEEIRNQ